MIVRYTPAPFHTKILVLDVQKHNNNNKTIVTHRWEKYQTTCRFRCPVSYNYIYIRHWRDHGTLWEYFSCFNKALSQLFIDLQRRRCFWKHQRYTHFDDSSFDFWFYFQLFRCSKIFSVMGSKFECGWNWFSHFCSEKAFALLNPTKKKLYRRLFFHILQICTRYLKFVVYESIVNALSDKNAKLCREA